MRFKLVEIMISQMIQPGSNTFGANTTIKINQTMMTSLSVDETTTNLPELYEETSNEEFDILSLLKNNEEVDEKKEVCNILMEFGSTEAPGQKHKLDDIAQVQQIKKKARKTPISCKCCNLCNNTFQVAAPQKKCIAEYCKGILEIVAKEPKLLKRAPPMCSKLLPWM